MAGSNSGADKQNKIRYNENRFVRKIAAKVLNFISAMMSILGLQTAMIAQFSGDAEHFRRMMNTITGSTVYAIVIAIAVYMLIHSKKPRKQVEAVE